MPAVRALSLSALVLCTVSSALASSTNQTLPMPVPNVVKDAQVVGRLAPATKLHLSLSLAVPNKAAFESYADQVSNPRSPFYHRFMSPAQIGERFGPSQNTVNAAVKYLTSKGMKITLVTDNRMTILFDGRADKVETAFSTKLNRYANANRTDGGPAKFVSFATTPSLPKSLAPQVLAIGGLQNAYQPKHGSTLSPADLRKVYDVASLYDAGRNGQGINIGITNFDGYRLSNLPIFFSNFNIPGSANVTKVPVSGDGETYAPVGEGDLDLQCTFGMAPRSHVFIYDGKYLTDTSGDPFVDLVSVLARIANDDNVDIVTESYGFYSGPEVTANLEAAHQQHVAMTLQGITYLACSGDTGTDWFGYPNVDPDVLSVGGSYVTSDPAGNRQAEAGWDGSGSGYKTDALSFNVMPSYQRSATMPSGVNRRLFPDIALHATGANVRDTRDPRGSTGTFVPGYYLVYGGSMTGASGTSASSPTFAAQLGLMLQELAAQGAADIAPNGRPRLGRLHDYIYGLNGDPTVFLDLLGGDAGLLPNGQEALGAPGWDFVTGWGAPIGSEFLAGLLGSGSTSVEDTAVDAGVFATATPAITFGTQVLGNVSALPTADGVTYSAQSVKQSGVGQVAALTVDFVLNGDPAKRRSAGLSLTFSSPNLTTGFVYLYNYTTGNYDVVKTVTGSGATKTVSVTSVDLSKYVQNDSMRVLIRAMKPSRLGSTAFRLAVDRVVVTERVGR